MSRSTIRITFFALVAILLFALPGTAMARKHARHGKTHKARVADRNHDGLPDAWEKANHLSLKVNQSQRDQDHDGLTNAAEFVAATDPRNADSNGDGTPDGEQNAGTVVSFTNGVLVIAGFGGTQVTGTVDASTELRCRSTAQTVGEDDAAAAMPPTAVKADNGGGDQGDDDAVTPATTPGTTPAPGTQTGDNQGGDDNEGGDHGGDHQSAGCDPATVLVPGAVVHEADLKVTATGNVWNEIKIVLNPPTAPVTTAPAASTGN